MVQRNIPFSSRKTGIEHNNFIGREYMCSKFIDLTWHRSQTRKTFIGVIEGRSTLGKSSFADWCISERPKSRDSYLCETAVKGNVLTCIINIGSIKSEENLFAYLSNYIHKKAIKTGDISINGERIAPKMNSFWRKIKTIKSLSRNGIIKFRQVFRRNS